MNRIKEIVIAGLILAAVGASFTNGVLWNRPRPQFYLADLHYAYKGWVLKELEKGDVLVGVLEVPGTFHAWFGSHRIHSVRLNPDDPGRWEWNDGQQWRELPNNTRYHLE